MNDKYLSENWEGKKPMQKVSEFLWQSMKWEGFWDKEEIWNQEY